MSPQWLHLILAAIVTEAVSETVEDGGGTEELALLGEKHEDEIEAVSETVEDSSGTEELA